MQKDMSTCPKAVVVSTVSIFVSMSLKIHSNSSRRDSSSSSTKETLQFNSFFSKPDTAFSERDNYGHTRVQAEKHNASAGQKALAFLPLRRLRSPAEGDDDHDSIV